jgi:choline-sulfatase
LLTGSGDGWDDEVFAQYSTRHQSTTHMRCYRTSQWKLVRDFNNPQRDELFNLIADPSETTNVIDQQQYQAIVALLHAKLLSKMKEINDPALP